MQKSLQLLAVSKRRQFASLRTCRLRVRTMLSTNQRTAASWQRFLSTPAIEAVEARSYPEPFLSR